MAGNEYDGYGGADKTQSEPSIAASRRSKRYHATAYVVTAIVAMWVGGLAVVGYYLPQVSLNVASEAPHAAEKVPDPYPQWVVDIRGGGHEEFFEDLCRGIAFVERNADRAKAEVPAGELSVDTNLPKMTGSEVRNYALVVAQSLYQTFTFRRSSRLHLCALATLSPWSFHDGHELMKVLLLVMQTANLTPADLGTDVVAKTMRDVLIGDMRDHLQEYRDHDPLQAGHDSEKGSVAYAPVMEQWQADWNFTAQELFLQTGEIAALEELAARDKEGAGIMPPR